MDVDHPKSLEVLVSYEACLQLGRGCLSGAVIVRRAFLALAALACLSPVGDGAVHSWLALISPLFCEWAWWCLRLGFFFFCRIAIPQSGLLSQVSSLRLPSGHSGLVLTLSNAVRAFLSSSHLLVADGSVLAAGSCH